MVFQQFRAIDTPAGRYTDLDMEFEVSMSKKGKTKLDFAIWNLKRDSWKQLQTGETIAVELGWGEGPQAQVFNGDITSRSKKVDGNNVKFKLKAVDKSGVKLNKRLKGTWEDKDPGTIAEDIAGAVGLESEVTKVGDPISGYWSVAVSQPLKKWLDELEKIAEEKTGKEWVWFGEAGRLYFQRKKATVEEAPILSRDKNIIEIGRADDTSGGESDAEVLEFTAMMTPEVGKGQLVQLEADPFTGAYKIQSFKHRSSSNSDDHFTSGRVIPTQADYNRSPEFNDGGPI